MYNNWYQEGQQLVLGGTAGQCPPGQLDVRYGSAGCMVQCGMVLLVGMVQFGSAGSLALIVGSDNIDRDSETLRLCEPARFLKS